MNKIYIASSLHNADRVRSLMDLFESKGAIITYDWTTHGQVFEPEDLRKYGEAEFNGVVEADVLFFVQPGRSGAHLELGIALAPEYIHSKIIVMLEEPHLKIEQKTFYHLDRVIKFDEEKQAVNFILEKMRIL